MRALLVEDDATIGEFVVRGLREAGFVVDHAPDGEAGLTAATQQAYDVAIVDLMLPKRDGLSLIEELRRRGERVRAELGLGRDAHGGREPLPGFDDFMAEVAYGGIWDRPHLARTDRMLCTLAVLGLLQRRPRSHRHPRRLGRRELPFPRTS